MAEIIAPQRTEPYLEPDLTPTLRFAEVVEQLVSEVNDIIAVGVVEGGTADSSAISSLQREINNQIIQSVAPLSAKIADLEKKIEDLTVTQ